MRISPFSVKSPPSLQKIEEYNAGQEDSCATLAPPYNQHGRNIVNNKKPQLLQDPFLNQLRLEHVPVSVYLVNGIKLQGQIESFDQYVVLLRNTVTQMVYKHAISTIVPGRPVQFQIAQPADSEDAQ